MRSASPGHLALASSILLSTTLALAIAACGDGAQGPGAQVPVSPSASAGSSATPPVASGQPPAPSGSAAGAVGTHVPVGPMKAVAASAMADDLKKLGIDPLKPPPLNKLSPDVVRKVMPSFAKSLGVKCDYCHDTNDFKAWTPHKRVASRMWQEFVVGLARDDGSPLYCDSCHAGHPEFLDRHDKKALSAWMEANFVAKLKRTDKKEHTCETCHGDPFEPAFLAQWHTAPPSSGAQKGK